MGVTVKTWPGGQTPASKDATLVLDIGVAVVPQLDVLTLEDDSDYYVRAILIYSLSDGCYIPREVTVGMSSLANREDQADALRGHRLESEPPVSSVSLRQVKVAELVKQGSADGIFLQFQGYEQMVSLRSSWGIPGDPDPEKLGFYSWMRPFGDIPREDLLRTVAIVYMVAVMAGESPALTVEREFNLAKRTAANWIARAKEEGLIRTPGLRDDDGEHSEAS